MVNFGGAAFDYVAITVKQQNLCQKRLSPLILVIDLSVVVIGLSATSFCAVSCISQSFAAVGPLAIRRVLWVIWV